MYCAGTWNTEKVYAQRLALTHPDPNNCLRRFLPPLPKGEFPKKYQLQFLSGPKYGSFQDAIEIPPRTKQIAMVANKLRRLAKAQPVDYEAIREAMRPLQGENYSHYVRPPSDELAAGTRRVLIRMLTDVNAAWIELERIAWEALMEYHKDWLICVVNMDLLVRIEGILVTLTNEIPARVMLVLPSLFLVCSPDASVLVRVRAMRALLIALQLLFDSGNITLAHYTEVRERVRCYLMTLEGLQNNNNTDNDFEEEDENIREIDAPCQEGDLVGFSEIQQFNVSHFSGSYREASINYFPKGHCQGVTRRVRCVTNGVLDVGQLEGMHLDVLLQDVFPTVLRAHGLLSLSHPLMVNYNCEGLIAVGDKFPHRPCTCTDPDVDIIYMGSRVGQDHGLYGHIVCNDCYQRRNPRERALLEAVDYPNENQKKRLVRLQNHTGQRTARIMMEASGATYDEALSSVAPATPSPRKRKAETTAKDTKPKKKAGFHRFSQKRILYPDSVQALLKQGAQHLVEISGKSQISSECVLAVFDMIVVDQFRKGKLKQYKMKILENGKPMPYYEYAYFTALVDILIKTPGKGKKTWQVVHPVRFGPRHVTGLTDAEYARRAFDALNL
jgi:hypothetical protein